MSNRLTRWLQSDDFFPKKGVDDVLILSTGENLEAHAEKAAEEAEHQFDIAKDHEAVARDSLDDAIVLHELSVERRFNKERLVRSVTAIFRQIRPK